MTVIIVATVGIVINGATAWLFASGRKGDINIRGAYLHMASDAAVSLGVMVAGLVILFTGRTWLDAATSLVISAVIVAGTWSLLRDSMAMSLSAVPPGIDPEAVRRFLEQRDARLGGREPTCGAVNQALANSVLQRRQSARDGLR